VGGLLGLRKNWSGPSCGKRQDGEGEGVKAHWSQEIKKGREDEKRGKNPGESEMPNGET